MNRRKNRKLNNQGQPKMVFCLLVSLVFVCIFSYGYLIRDTIVNIVNRQALEAETVALRSEIITLESQYIKLKNTVTRAMASDLGFVEVSSPKYVTAKVTGPNLSLASERE